MERVEEKREWREIAGCKVDVAVHDHLIAHGLTVRMAPDGYPWVHDGGGKRMQPLHLFAWELLRGSLRPRKFGEIIHHRRRKKRDARIRELGIGTPRDHGRVHRLHDQKFQRRKRLDLHGFYRPHARAKVFVVYQRPDTAPPQIAKQWVKSAAPRWESAASAQMHRRLEDRLADLQAAVDHLDSGNKIPAAPKGRTRKQKNRDRMLGITSVRRGCSPSEAAFVRLLVLHRFDIEDAALDLGVDADWLRSLRKVPAVSLALERWFKYRRLPRPCFTADSRRRAAVAVAGECAPEIAPPQGERADGDTTDA